MVRRRPAALISAGTDTTSGAMEACCCAERQAGMIGSSRRRLPIIGLMLLCTQGATAEVQLQQATTATAPPTKWFEDPTNLPDPLPGQPTPMPTKRPTLPISEKEENDWLMPDEVADSVPYEGRPLDEDASIVQQKGHWGMEDAALNRKNGIEYRGGRDGHSWDADVSDHTRRRAPAGMTAVCDLYTYGAGTMTNRELVRFRAGMGATLGPFICDMYRQHGEITTSCDLSARGMDITIEHVVGPQALRFPDATLYSPAGHPRATEAPVITVSFRVIFGDCSLGTQSVLKQLPMILKSQLRSGRVFALLSDIDHPLEAVGLAHEPVVVSCRPEIKLQMPKGFKILDSAVQCRYDGNKITHVHRNAEYWAEHHFFCKHYVDAAGSHKCACKTWTKDEQDQAMAAEIDAEQHWTPPTFAPTKWHLPNEDSKNALAKAVAAMPTPAPTALFPTPSVPASLFPTEEERTTHEDEKAANAAGTTKPSQTEHWWDMDTNKEHMPTASPTWPWHGDTKTPTLAPTHRPVSCLLSTWKPEFGHTGDCSASCGGGLRSEKRVILHFAQWGGRACPPASQMRRRAPCNSKPCTASPTPTPTTAPTGFDAYSKFSSLHDMREEYATTTAPTASPSKSPTPAPVDCVLSAWGAWTPCSKTCGGGERTRRRVVLAPGNKWGNQCDDVRLGGLAMREACNLYACAINNAVTFEVKLPSLQADSLEQSMQSKGVPDEQWHAAVVRKVAAMLSVPASRVTMAVRSSVQRRLLTSTESSAQSAADSEDSSGMVLLFTVLAPSTVGVPGSVNGAITPQVLAQEVAIADFGARLSSALEPALMLPPGALAGAAGAVVEAAAELVHVDEVSHVKAAAAQSLSAVLHAQQQAAEKAAREQPQDCEVSDFGSWTACTKTCGGAHHLEPNSAADFGLMMEEGGWHIRSRIVIKEPLFGGMACPVLMQKMPCNRIPCDVAQREQQTHAPTGPPTRAAITQKSVTGGGSDKTLLESLFDNSMTPRVPALAVLMELPTPVPTRYPTTYPSNFPTTVPTPAPTTLAPTRFPTTMYPTSRPTRWYERDWPTPMPTKEPTLSPLEALPTMPPTFEPTAAPTTPAPTAFSPLDCVQGTWGEWTACPLTCSNYMHAGQQSRFRVTITPPDHGGKPCGESEDSHYCQVPPCPVTSLPTATPTAPITAAPMAKPTALPTGAPTEGPTAAPTPSPILNPTATPSVPPTPVPTGKPTLQPSAAPKLCKCHGDTPCLFEDGQTCIAKQYMSSSHRCPPKTTKCYCPCHTEPSRPCFQVAKRHTNPGLSTTSESLFDAPAAVEAEDVGLHVCLALTSLHGEAVCPQDSYRCLAEGSEHKEQSGPPEGYLGNGVVELEGSGR